MKMHIALTIGLATLLGALTVWGMWAGSPSAVQAQEPAIRYVATTGTDAGDCADPAHPCATVQYAVDQAQPSDGVHIATGVYTDVHQRAGITQTVYISKTVALRGGYPADFSGSPDPDIHPTTLDAQGQGRVLYIIGAISPTVEGLCITGGNATGLGDFPWENADIGGGMYILTATATIRSNQVFSNTARLGGGLFLYASASTINCNVVTTNTTDLGRGGGLYLYKSATILSENTVSANVAYNGGGMYLDHSNAAILYNTITRNTTKYGGGLSLWFSDVVFNENTVADNTAEGNGGGLSLASSVAILNGNTVIANTAGARGGGLDLFGSTATLNGNAITANTAGREGGGLSLYTFNDVTLFNNLVTDNQAKERGDGLYIESSYLRLRHTTIAHNGSNNGVYVIGDRWLGYSTADMINTILVSHTVGISVTGGNKTTLNGILWYDTPITISQAATATVTVQNQHWDDPAFLNPTAGDYHIGPGSAALNAGVDAGVYTDIDGEPRPYQLPDLGADEYWPPGALKRLYLPLAFRG